MERAEVKVLFEKPLHPYTFGLMQSRPDIDRPIERLQPIPGSPPNLIDVPTGCPFHPRCTYVQERCKVEVPVLREVEPAHESACHFAEVLRGMPHDA